MYFIRMGFQLIVVVAVNARVQVNAYAIRFIKGSYARNARYVSLLCICYSTCFPRPSSVSSRFICNEKVFSISVCIFSAIGRKHDIINRRCQHMNSRCLPYIPVYPYVYLMLYFFIHITMAEDAVLAHIVMLCYNFF